MVYCGSQEVEHSEFKHSPRMTRCIAREKQGFVAYCMCTTVKNRLGEYRQFQASYGIVIKYILITGAQISVQTVPLARRARLFCNLVASRSGRAFVNDIFPQYKHSSL